MLTKNLSAHKYFWLFLASSWTILIAVLCLISFKKLPSIVSLPSADKYAHFSFHLVFTLLWYLCFKSIKNGKWLLIKVLLLSVCYGGLIELMQGWFTDTRKADWNDVAANSFGAIIAILLILMYEKMTKKNAL